MTLKVNIPRVVLNRPDGYTFSKIRFPKLKTLEIEYMFDCLGDAGKSTDGDSTQFLDIISQDVTQIVIRDLSRYQGCLRVECVHMHTDLLAVKGRALGDWASKSQRHTFGDLAVEIHDLNRSISARSDRSQPPLAELPPGHPPDETLDAIIIVQATF